MELLFYFCFPLLEWEALGAHLSPPPVRPLYWSVTAGTEFPKTGEELSHHLLLHPWKCCSIQLRELWGLRREIQGQEIQSSH